MITIDGSQGEGGGQMIRTSLALSIVTGQPLYVKNIRANRSKPGLAPQHLAGVLAAAQICGAQVEGAHLRSSAIRFEPTGPAQPGAYTFDVSQLADTPSAGAVTLLLQAILLPLALADGPTTLTLRGGTHVAWSPPLHYVEWVLLPTLARMGVQAAVDLRAWGWYPRGGGEVVVTIEGGAQLQGIDLSERGDLQHLQGVAVASNLPAHIPQRIANRANNLLEAENLPQGIDPLRTGGPSIGAGLFTQVVYEHVHAGFSSLGKRGKPSEAVANEAVEALTEHHESGYALDEYLPDQLMPFIALADGPSTLRTVEITGHTLTNRDVIGRFLDRTITIEGTEGDPGVVSTEE